MKREISKLNLRLPVDLRERMQAVADFHGRSLNAQVVEAVMNYLPFAERRLPRVRRVAIAPTESGPEPPPPLLVFPKVGRNDPCPCGSGRKAKHCHQSG